MPIVKICGITNLEDAKLAVSLGADAVGFIFADSPRGIEPKEAKGIIDKIKGKISAVGIFVNETLEKVSDIADTCSLDLIQLHGDESPEYCAELNKLTIIKAFRMKDKESLSALPRYKTVFAYLLDTFSKNSYGGTGKIFDWNLAIQAKTYGKPIILSGGLGPANLEDAINCVMPYGVDISSSIEVKPGIKDAELMKRVIQIVKGIK